MDITDETAKVSEPDFSYSGIYTYADYLKWSVNERLELIKGKVFRMSPAPNRYHQTISGRIFSPLWQFLKHKQCQVFSAPFDVRLPRKSKEDKDIVTVVQPDICVIRDPEKLDEKGCIGAPDLVIEILSPGNNAKELRDKYEAYEGSGVKEYWIVSPYEQTTLIYSLKNGKFEPSKLMTTGDIVQTDVLPGYKLDLKELFENLY